MFIKLCGFTRTEDIKFIKDLPISSAGFIFHKKSKRYVTPRQAGEMSLMLKESGIKSTGVFVDDDTESILQIAESAYLDMVQVYSSITAAELSLSVSVIECVRVGGPETMMLPAPQPGGMVLFDTYSAEAHGGTGKCFNHGLLGTYPYKDRMIIAGGLNESNIKGIIRQFQPGGVDISSGIEISPGIKSQNKILKILKLIEEAENEINA